MATKNLARTVIEGGRSRWSKWYRTEKTAAQRARQRQVLSHARLATELDDLVVPERESGFRDFSDKLGPARRWLASHVGRPWDAVRSELFDRFDIRTTPGRHIIFCHLLPSVNQGGRLDDWRVEFNVDRRGILRRAPKRPSYWSAREQQLPRPQTEIEDWLAGRRVGARGTTLFWFIPTASGSFRQDRRLSDEDRDLWLTLPQWFRERNGPSAPAVTRREGN
jgi:hypothetical protein